MKAKQEVINVCSYCNIIGDCSKRHLFSGRKKCSEYKYSRKYLNATIDRKPGDEASSSEAVYSFWVCVLNILAIAGTESIKYIIVLPTMYVYARVFREAVQVNNTENATRVKSQYDSYNFRTPCEPNCDCRKSTFSSVRFKTGTFGLTRSTCLEEDAKFKK